MLLLLKGMSGEFCPVSEAHAVQVERSAADYFFEKAERYFCRARANLNARVALEAVGNAFMVKAIELDIKLSRPKAATPSNRLGTDASTADKLLADGSKY